MTYFEAVILPLDKLKVHEVGDTETLLIVTCGAVAKFVIEQ